MSQDVNNDWVQREFVESVELSLRKCVNFLNHFQESASYRLSHIDGRLTSLERNLDFIEAQLKHANPEERGGSGTPFKKSVFDPETRRDMKQRAYDLRIKPRAFTKKVIAPMKRKGPGMIIAGAGAKAKAGGAGGAGMVRAGPGAKAPTSTASVGEGAAPSKAAASAGTAATSSSSSAGPGASAEGAPAKSTAEGPGAAAAGTITPGAGSVSSAAAKGPGASGESASAAGGAGGEGEAAVFPHGKPDQIDFRAVQQGSGPRPAPTSKVDIAYTVYLSDGKELLTHRETVSLGVKQNIKGLELGLLRMNTGMKAKLWVPYRLGYGAKGAGDMIPPAADLTFDIELIAIVEM